MFQCPTVFLHRKRVSGSFVSGVFRGGSYEVGILYELCPLTILFLDIISLL